MDGHIKNQIENIAELCNWSAEKRFLQDVAQGRKIFDVTLQFYQLCQWRIHLEYDSGAVYFVKWEDDELIKHFAGHSGNSPLDVVNEFYDYAKDLIDAGFVCIPYAEIEDF